MNKGFLAGLCLGIGLLPLSGQARDFGEGLVSLSASIALENQDGRYNHWNGIGRIVARDGLHCTATLLDTRSPDSPADAPAYLLTNGHCLEKKNGLIVTDRAVEGEALFNYFTDTQPQSFALKQINWSSTQGVDLAVVELQQPLSALIAAGIEPIALARDLPPIGSDILLVGAPLKPGTGHLRLAACTQQESADVLEQPWLWRNSVKNQCRDLSKGSSGSPILSRTSNEVFAVLNTSTQGNPGSGKPLELPENFPVPSPDSNYGSAVTFLRSCFAQGLLVQDPQECPLFPAYSITFDSPAKRYAKIGQNADGQPVYPAWDLRFSLDTPFYRYKQVDRASQCESPHHYSAALPAENTRIDDPIGQRPGLHLLCIVGAKATDERPSLGMMRNALTLAAELMPAGPTAAPELLIKPAGSGYSVIFAYDSRLFSHYGVKFGPPRSTDCSDSTGQRKTAPRQVHFASNKLPLKLCTLAYDLNGQPSAVREDLLEQRPAGEERPPGNTRFSYIGLGDEPRD
ncbi:serine protease [Pseudomonas sp. Pseusp122]|uniref:trypsin-like serine peptidase n=1 Tax=unclassified Pseudomonas TaxID=196821 RepID=UPI0039A4C5A0